MAAMYEHSSSGPLAPSSTSRYAARPATWGHAIEVPEMVRVAVEEPTQALVTLTPGAKTSTTSPKLEKLARLSLMSVAPIVQTWKGGKRNSD